MDLNLVEVGSTSDAVDVILTVDWRRLDEQVVSIICSEATSELDASSRSE